MLYLLSQWSNAWGPLRLFDYVTFRAGGAAFTAFLIVALLGGWTARKLKALNVLSASRLAGLVPQEYIDKAKDKTPCMGGLLLIGAVLISACLWTVLSNPIGLVFILATFFFSAIGFYDDFRKVVYQDRNGLPAKFKLLLQLIVAILVVIAFLQIPELNPLMKQLCVPFVKKPLSCEWLPWLTFPLAVIVIAGTANAVNFTDGKDGLSSGCTIFCSLAYAVIAYLMSHKVFANYLSIPFIPGVQEAMVFAAALCGGCIGFLWHNCYPASMFMGDTGSLALGGAVGMLAVLVRQEILLVLIGGVYVMEIVSVMIQVTSFKLTGKRVFLCTPIHHHFERLGWTETQIVVRFWILGGLFALVALATLKIR